MPSKSIHCTIKGTSPILMHAYPLVPIVAFEKKPADEQAELAAYRDPDTRNLFVPGVAIQRCLVGAAAFSKGRGRSSLQKPVAACVLVTPERCSLGVQVYTVDARPVVIPATKGRGVRYRPRLDEWQVSFGLEYDNTLLTEVELREVVDNGGSRVGPLDFRPEKKGPFGRFMVTDWHVA